MASVRILVASGFLLNASLVGAQQMKQTVRDSVYRRYLELPTKLVYETTTPAHWTADGSTFWYAQVEHGDTAFYRVNPNTNTRARLPRAPVDSVAVPARPKPVGRELLAPDAGWFAGVKDHNIYVRPANGGASRPLTTDGVRGYGWDYDDYFEVEARWSPDSRKLAAMKLDYRQVDSMPLVHWLKPRPDVEWQSWRRADGPQDRAELFVLDILSKQKVRVDTGNDPDLPIMILDWQSNGSELYFARMDREYKRLELLAADPATGHSRIVLTETSNSYIGGWEVGGSARYHGFDLLADGKRFLWQSERDGSNQIYLYSLDGTMLRRLTPGTFPVVTRGSRVGGVVTADEPSGWVYFYAHADSIRPYDTQLFRVQLDGTHLTRLTDGSGQHFVRFSPSKQFFFNLRATMRSNVTVLRKADGTLLQTIDSSNFDAYTAMKLRPPEEFVVKAADGKTDLYGMLYLPYDFDPGKKYPVIDFIYAGAMAVEVPQWLGQNVTRGAEGMAQLGFVTFIVDGRGTPERGKAFQDVVYLNVGRYEIPDHVAALRALAASRPYMDLSRVGITGSSWGGHFALRAMLQAPDVYQVGVAIHGDIDLFNHLPNDITPWMGPPDKHKEAYEYGSNYWLADRLRGKLLLIEGTSDSNVPFAPSMRMVSALIGAEKFFDLIVEPEGTHFSTPYIREATRRYLVEHLKPAP